MRQILRPFPIFVAAGRMALVLLLWLCAGLVCVQAQQPQSQESQPQENRLLAPVVDKAATDIPVKTACLSSHEVRALVERGEVIPVHRAMQMTRSHFGGEIVKARLCLEQDRLIYLLTLLDKNSQISLVAMDARNGQLIARP